MLAAALVGVGFLCDFFFSRALSNQHTVGGTVSGRGPMRKPTEQRRIDAKALFESINQNNECSLLD